MSSVFADLTVRDAFVHLTSFLILVLMTLAVHLPATTSAQVGLDTGFGPDLSLEISPQYPEPGETVVVKARSILVPLSATPLAWFVDGKLILEGMGVMEKEIVAGELGSEAVVRAVATYEGSLHSASITIRPAELDLLWESDSFVPPFFRGRALPSAGTVVRLEAIPRLQLGNGARVAVKDIVFTWRRNGYVISGTSGRGKSKVTIASPSLFGTDTVSVEARSIDGRSAAEASVRLPSEEPHIALYQNHPLFGVTFHTAIEPQTFVPETEITLAAIPYYADVSSPDEAGLSYEWQVNGQPIELDPKRPSSITINAAGSSGIALIELALSHVTNFFLNTAGSWRVTLLGDGDLDSPFSAEGGSSFGGQSGL